MSNGKPETTDPRVAAVVARMEGWNCFEPLRPGALQELAAEVISAADAADAIRTDTDAAHGNWARLWGAQRVAIIAAHPELARHPHLQEQVDAE